MIGEENQNIDTVDDRACEVSDPNDIELEALQMDFDVMTGSLNESDSDESSSEAGSRSGPSELAAEDFIEYMV